MRDLAFTVVGRPATQGSKVRTRFGMRESSTTLEPWREAVRHEARLAMGDREAMVGPLRVSLSFKLARAKSNRATWPIGQRSGDVDKLARAVLDALTQADVWGDDAQVVDLRVHKSFGDRPSALITVTEVVE